MNDWPPTKRKSYKCAPPLITEHGIAEAEKLMIQLASNISPEGAAYIQMCLNAGRGQLASASKDRAHLRDQRLIFAARHERFHGMSDRAIATEMLSIASRLKDRPVTEPEYSIWRIKQLNNGKMPSAETIRKCLALK